MSRLNLTPVNIPALAAAPTVPTIKVGDLYFNTGIKALYVWNGTVWSEAGGGVTVSASEPTTNLREGLLWFDSTSDSLLVYYDGEFVLAGGGGGTSTASAADLTSAWFLGV
jgi:hypothetical protein